MTAVPRNHASLARRAAGLAAGLVAALAAGCATTFDNLPLNRPVTPEFVSQAAMPRDIVGRDVIGLSLSGGGMRAAAFSFGVLKALAGDEGRSVDVYDDITFISSVSGGSMTAAYVGLHGRGGLAHLRERVLLQDLERDLRIELLSPSNLLRLLAGGLNDRSNLARRLDAEVFHGATFADLYRRNKPDVWMNATDLYNRTPFPFTPQAFLALCSDLPSLGVSEAVAASMAVPLVFAPVVLQTFPERCLTPLPERLAALLDDPARVATDPVASVARAIGHYRDPQRMRYLKLADGGLTDNQGLSSILVARALSGTAYGPLNEADAVRIRRLLFFIVDAGRPPAGDWALRLDGPSGIEVGVAAADAAIDAATRLSSAAFRTMVREWRDSIVQHRCALDASTVRRHLPEGEAWKCDDVQFVVETISAEALGPEQARRLREMPTRLVLPAADVDAAIAAGRDATLRSRALRDYLAGRAVNRR